jgi:glycosyltransferase involved in cell wall biosynthesis
MTEPTHSKLIIVPFHAPWNRSADFQRQTCIRLAQTHTVIALLTYESEFWLTAWLKKLVGPARPSSYENVQFSRPQEFFLGRRFDWIKKTNQLLWLWWLKLKHRRQTDRWLWIFEPEFFFFAGLKGWNSLYDCVDDHSQTDPAATARQQALEKRLIKAATLFTVNSHVLAQLHQAIRKPDAIVVQGFDTTAWPNRLPPRKKTASSTISLFAGLDDRVDWPLLIWLAQQLPQTQFLLAGPIQPDCGAWLAELTRLSNVRYLGFLPRAQLKRRFNQTTIGLIPYRIELATVRHSFPMKVFEYFAYGKPVVSSPILELLRYQPLVTIAKTRSAWKKSLQAHLKQKWSPANQLAQRQLAWEHRYEAKLAQILQLMEKNPS